ncbi:OmpA family protein [Burkholderia vietnamiensis]|uniref:OmpA family protein n=1 Tax=Burkholderia vietnamiensis TaxID=60552 RepID=UPI001D15B578|nr:OmpA family protein [Burkholderia vietnamiensis]UEC01769.1 OmpA family protein [Burkholderia vietnamiensis]
MMRNGLRLSAHGALAIASVLIAGCAAVSQDPPALPSSPAPLRLAQIGYGLDATFEACRADICPQRTMKTISGALVPPPQALVIPDAIPENSLRSHRDDRLPATVSLQSADRQDLRQLDIQFAFASAELDSTARGALRELAARLGNVQEIRIVGRTDSTGTRATNERLAKARADAVLRELVGLTPGITPITTVDAQGSCCYAQSNDSPAGRARNRRVEIRYRGNQDGPP